MPTKFSNLSIRVSEGTTAPSVTIDDVLYYVNIGSGTVLKISWDTPVAPNNLVDVYHLSITAYDTLQNKQVSLLNKYIGNINEYYVTADLLSTVALSTYMLTIQLTAKSIYGTSYDSAATVTTAYVCNGDGTYIKTNADSSQPIMKRSIGFAKLNFPTLFDKYGKSIFSAEDKTFTVKATGAQDNETGWAVMQEFYSKDDNGDWQKSDLRYEVLTDENGNIVTDANNSPVYIL